MRVLGFGTYDSFRQPRVAVLLDGLRQHGAQVDELNIPLGFSTPERVEMLHKPWLLYRLLARLGRRWAGLALRRTRLRSSPDVVVVGYLAQFDVLLARLLFPRTLIALDLLILADDTGRDRGLRSGARTRLLRLLDRAATRCASIVIVDTEENQAMLTPAARSKSVVAPVGASDEWFCEPVGGGSSDGLKVVFFGLFTPLQGGPTIGAAIAALPPDARIEISMIGTGQDYEETRSRAGGDARVRWINWMPPEDLAKFVSRHDVCLGIFGTSPKALRVVPTKVFQGAAAGCAIITSDTVPQRRALADAALYVPSGDAVALAESLVALAGDPRALGRLRHAAFAVATEAFRPSQVSLPVMERLVKELP